MEPKIAIAGGGFGGLYAARALERLLPPEAARIVVVNEVNFMLYTPLLPGAAAGTLEPRHVVVPIREELKRTQLQLGSVVGLSRPDQHLLVRPKSGNVYDLPYDHLIVALGSVPRTLPIPGLAEHAVGFKTLAEAIHLRNHVIGQFELAESSSDRSARAAHLGFVFVGGGYAGLEALAELHDFASELIDLYPRCRTEGMRWVLVEAADTVLPEVGTGSARFATSELEQRGIKIRTNTALTSCTDRSATLSSGETIAARTLVWTAGVAPHPTVGELGLPLDDRGRIRVSNHMLVERTRNIWALGDAAAVPDPARPGQPCPPTAQHAIRQGKTVARNVAAALGFGRAASFSYRTRGTVIDLGRHQAVASMYGIRLRGFFAWWLTRTYHLLWLLGLKRKLRLVADWTVGLIFGRDASELGTIGHPPPLEQSAWAEQGTASGKKNREEQRLVA